MSELSMEEKIRLNKACNGDKTFPLTRFEMDYCYKHLRGDRLSNADIATKLGVKLHDVMRWQVAGRALEGRGETKPPTGDEELPQTITEKIQNRYPWEAEAVDPPEFVKLPADAPPPQVEEIKPSRILTATPTTTQIVPAADPLIAAALEVRRTATACAEAEAAHHAAVERLQDEISAVRYPDAEAVFAPELAVQEPAPPDHVNDSIDYAEVRVWAKAEGIAVSPVGRIKAEVVELYRQARSS